ncbi:Extracellular sulfatase SULF-1 homolog [Eumeta japonica]|uniref:Extracellular sulfatase SULF-1 homolog n=1 Tax=Eumeta variegata TaxID=151549 RepID=A0A4C1ZX22_EUMVA|nr:Extracellular sulfatase SULF-1 homolog [Eumeta japonica]
MSSEQTDANKTSTLANLNEWSINATETTGNFETPNTKRASSEEQITSEYSNPVDFAEQARHYSESIDKILVTETVHQANATDEEIITTSNTPKTTEQLLTTEIPNLGPTRLDVSQYKKSNKLTNSNNLDIPARPADVFQRRLHPLYIENEDKHVCYCEENRNLFLQAELEALRIGTHELLPARQRALEDGALVDGGAVLLCMSASNNTYNCVRTINATHNLLYCEFVTGLITYYNLRIGKLARVEMPRQYDYYVGEAIREIRACMKQASSIMISLRDAKQSEIFDNDRKEYFHNQLQQLLLRAVVVVMGILIPQVPAQKMTHIRRLNPRITNEYLNPKAARPVVNCARSCRPATNLIDKLPRRATKPAAAISRMPGTGVIIPISLSADIHQSFMDHLTGFVNLGLGGDRDFATRPELKKCDSKTVTRARRTANADWWITPGTPGMRPRDLFTTSRDNRESVGVIFH